MTRDDFRHRRAKRGQGARRLVLLQQLWEADNMITHFIIMGVAGNQFEAGPKRARAEADRALAETELLEITHECRAERTV